MASSLGLGGLSWKELARRVWAETQDDDVCWRAAQLSYYYPDSRSLPLLLFLTSLVGIFAGEDSELRNTLFNYLGTVLPAKHPSSSPRP
jgi:uncharacterized BrkB/YihY/UPF0761 family membrane protein